MMKKQKSRDQKNRKVKTENRLVFKKSEVGLVRFLTFRFGFSVQNRTGGITKIYLYYSFPFQLWIPNPTVTGSDSYVSVENALNAIEADLYNDALCGKVESTSHLLTRRKLTEDSLATYSCALEKLNDDEPLADSSLPSVKVSTSLSHSSLISAVSNYNNTGSTTVVNSDTLFTSVTDGYCTSNSSKIAMTGTSSFHHAPQNESRVVSLGKVSTSVPINEAGQLFSGIQRKMIVSEPMGWYKFSDLTALTIRTPIMSSVCGKDTLQTNRMSGVGEYDRIPCGLFGKFSEHCGGSHCAASDLISGSTGTFHFMDTVTSASNLHTYHESTPVSSRYSATSFVSDVSSCTMTEAVNVSSVVIPFMFSPGVKTVSIVNSNGLVGMNTITRQAGGQYASTLVLPSGQFVPLISPTSICSSWIGRDVRNEHIGASVSKLDGRATTRSLLNTMIGTN